MTGCVECTSKKECIFAASGYYLEVNFEGEYTGKAVKCGSTCATCSVYDSCDSCITNYELKGTSCIYYKNIASKLVLGPSKGSDSWFRSSDDRDVTLANAIMNLNQIISAIAAAAGVKKSLVIVTFLSFGSINVESIVQAPEGADIVAFNKDFQANV